MRPVRLLMPLVLLASIADPVSCRAAPPGTPKAEVERLQKALFRKTVLVKRDVHTTPERGRLAELPDGSYYELADPSTAFEELAGATIRRLALRKDGAVLLVTMVPPAYILPLHLREFGAPPVGAAVAVELDVAALGGVEEAVRSLVYMPGETPPEEAVARCLARYPGHDEARSRLRCGLDAPPKK